MTAHLTEEEQLQTLKRWWQENGKSTVISVVLAVGGFFGWQAWQASELAKADASSAIFQDLLQATMTDEPLSEEAAVTVNHIAITLKETHGSSLYALQAALIVAKLAVDEGRMADAVAELEWVLEQKPTDEIKFLATERLARVLAAEKEYDRALALLSETDAAVLAGFASTYAEIRGDIYQAQGKADEARTQYQSALARTDTGGMRRQILDMKLNDLQAAAQVADGSGE